MSGQEGEGWDSLFSGYTDSRLAGDDHKAMVLPVLAVLSSTLSRSGMKEGCRRCRVVFELEDS